MDGKKSNWKMEVLKMALVGVSKLHYALNTADDIVAATYNAAVQVANVIEVGINPNSQSATLFADNGPAETASALGEIEVEIDLADLPLAVQAVFLGHTVNGGVMVSNANDIPPYLALGFEALKSNGKKKYIWLLKGKFELPEDSYKTKSENIEFQSKKIKAKFVKLVYNDFYKREADEEHPDYVATIGTNWFTNGPLGVADTTAPTATVVPLDAATGVAVSANVVWTFSEAIQASTVIGANFFVVKASDNSIVAGSLAISANRLTVTFDPTANLTAATLYRATVTTAVKDLSGNALAAPKISSFTTA